MCYRNVIIGLSFKTVPKMGFRVFGKKLLSFSGGATGARIGRSMSLFEAFVFSEKSFCRFRGVQPAPMGAVACPFLRHSCFRKKAFAKIGT
jgi:hypothetical protein